MANQEGSLLGLPQLGLPSLTRTEALNIRKKEVAQEFRDRISESAALLRPSERNVFTQFANLGNEIGGKDITQLSPTEIKKFQTVEVANQRLKDISKTPEYQALPPIERAFKAKEALAQSAMDAGDFQTGSDILLEVQRARVARLQQQQALDNAQLTGKSAEVGLAQDALAYKSATETYAQMRGGKPATFMVPDENGKLSYEGIKTLRMSPDGQIVDLAGRPVENALPIDALGDINKAIKESQGRVGSDMKGFISNLKDRDKFFSEAQDVNAGARVVGRALSAMGDAVDPQQIVGTPGGILSFFDNLWNTGVGSYKNLSGIVYAETDNDGNPLPGSSTKTLSEVAEEYAHRIKIPAEFQQNVEAQNRYRAAVMQMVYLNARLLEPGARQLSDADIKNSMDSLGVKSDNPMAIVQTLIESYSSRADESAIKFKDVASRGSVHGIDSETAYKAVFGHNPITRLDETRKVLEDQYNSVMNKWGQTKRGVTGPQIPPPPTGGFDTDDGFTVEFN